MIIITEFFKIQVLNIDEYFPWLQIGQEYLCIWLLISPDNQKHKFNFFCAHLCIFIHNI